MAKLPDFKRLAKGREMSKKTTDTPPASVKSLLARFVDEVEPIEKLEHLYLLQDRNTGAWYCECHVSASSLVALATTDVPLDPESQGDYRANRDVVANHSAFKKMKEDAKKGRSFSNIVAEYIKAEKGKRPVLIIGGQHRFEAISEAVEIGIDEQHGIKVYLKLDKTQRLDVQLISNTNIAVSPDLFDRMQETVRGPELRDWCQDVGFLEDGQDFTDRKLRGSPMSVQMARTFITNFFAGMSVKSQDFSKTNTTPAVCASGQHDDGWEQLNVDHPDLWTNPDLKKAAREYAELAKAQRSAYLKSKHKPARGVPEKASNMAILSAWAYVAGILQSNQVRLQKHFDLRKVNNRDPLNASALATGKHKTDGDSYRGLGNRTDAKERGRFVELFFHQAELGCGITQGAVDIAIKKYHAKQAELEVIRAMEIE